jgi:integrase
MVGCGIYFGFRGVQEHCQLRVQDITIGVFGPDDPYPNRKYVGIGFLVNEKKHKVSTHESYERDTSNIMRIPVLDINDPNDFAGCIIRYLKKLEPGQVRMYCYLDPKKEPGAKYPFHKNKQIGKNPINSMFKEAVAIMGLNTENFRGGHAFRRYFVTGMANDPNVPLAESMRAARHTSVSAHMAYMQHSSATEAARVTHLLNRNAPPPPAEKEKASKKKRNDVAKKKDNKIPCDENNERKKNKFSDGTPYSSYPVANRNIGVKVDNPSQNSPSPLAIVSGVGVPPSSVPSAVVTAGMTQASYAVSSVSDFNSPANTQEELQAFNEECAIMENMPPPAPRYINNSAATHPPLRDVSNINHMGASHHSNSTHSVMMAKQRFSQFEGSRNSSPVEHSYARPATDFNTQRRSSTGSCTTPRYNHHHYHQNNATQNPYNITPHKFRHTMSQQFHTPTMRMNPYTKKPMSGSRIVMSEEQREIRRLRMQVREMNQKVQRRELEIKREQQVREDYEMKLEEASSRESDYMSRLEELETGVEFNHQMGSWSYNRSGNQRRNHYM